MFTRSLRFALVLCALVADVICHVDKVTIAYDAGSFKQVRLALKTFKFARDDISLPPFMRGAYLQLVGRDPMAGRVRLFSAFVRASGNGTFEISGGNTTVIFEIEESGISADLMVSPDGFVSGVVTQKIQRPPGMRLIRSKYSQPESVERLETAITSNPNGPRLITNIDHAKAAERVGLKLPLSNVIVFGRPEVGLPLWSVSAPIGIELPLEMLIAMSPLGVVYVGYTTPSVYRKRFDLSSRDENLMRIDMALTNLANTASGRNVSAAGLDYDEDNELLEELMGVFQESSNTTDAASAYSRLIEILEASPPVNIAYAIEHDKSAIAAGLDPEGRENKVAVFGNPSLGTGFMQSSFTAALDLPLKIGIWTVSKDVEKVFGGFVEPEWIAKRHSVGEIPPIVDALKNILGVALANV